jgi:hypothetical protein
VLKYGLALWVLKPDQKTLDAQKHRNSVLYCSCGAALVDVDAKRAQVFLRQINLGHDLLVRLGNVVEGQNAPAETEEQVSAERDEKPERELCIC